jgi:hypothetical protein
MRSKAKIICLVVIGLLCAAAPVPAHHGGASFDETKTVTVAGTVTDYIWANPHVYVIGSTGSSGPAAPRHRIIINGKQFQ